MTENGRLHTSIQNLSISLVLRPILISDNAFWIHFEPHLKLLEMAAPIPPDVLATGARHLLAGKYFQVAAYTMLIYDHAITFGEEVEKIWKRKITGAAILFLINRYASPLEFIVILDAFNDPNWSKAVCKRFVNFEGSATLGLVSICELIMILRVYALYKRNNYVLAFLLAVWITGIIVASVGMTSGFALDLPPPLVGCIDTGNGSLLPALWVVPLITNSLIFLLTLWQSRHFLRRPGIAPPRSTTSKLSAPPSPN